MSWDFYVSEKFNTCAYCGRAEEEIEHFNQNYTNNMWRMLKLANFDWDMIQDKPALEAGPELFKLIQLMESDPTTYRALNPRNGWGDYDSFLEVLKKFCTACINHPNAIVHISR